jgi:hypothetical protein
MYLIQGGVMFVYPNHQQIQDEKFITLTEKILVLDKKIMNLLRQNQQLKKQLQEQKEFSEFYCEQCWK